MAGIRVLGRVVLGAALLAGCGGDDSSGGTGGTAGTTGDGSAGRQCTAVMTAFCARAYKECSSSPTNYDACVNAGVPGCCQDHCGSTALSSQSSVDVCTNDIKGVDCTALMASPSDALPATCKGVVKIPLGGSVRGSSFAESVGASVSVSAE
ncbi:MAG TPA: hypothetical protein VHE30_03740 [Polyangiaceae bacterium]|nr:hypothetical protein [Polyangiaceae bacterium]